MRTIFIFPLALLLLQACDKAPNPVKEMKTAYVDTSRLLDEYNEAKDIEAKYKAKGDEMGKDLEAEVAKFKSEAVDFQKNAQSRGPAWAQENGMRLQKKEQELSYAQQALVQQIREESGVEMDSLVSKVKKFIKSYGKEKGYTYIYGTGEAATILYAEDKLDITAEIVRLLNEKYKSASKEVTPKEGK